MSNPKLEFFRFKLNHKTENYKDVQAVYGGERKGYEQTAG